MISYDVIIALYCIFLSNITQYIYFLFFLSPDECIINQMKNKIQFFFQSVQIYMIDAECAETNEKSNFRFFRFLFFRVMVIFVMSSPQFSINFSRKLICDHPYHFYFQIGVC